MRSPTRRDFLLNSLKAAGLALLAPKLSIAEERRLYAPEHFSSLQSKLEGLLIQPGEESFAQLAKPWNLRYSDRKPAAIVRCATVQDIGTSLSWAREQNVPFVVRSGGHSYAAFSTTPGLLIDVSQLRSVDMNPTTGIVRLGPGSRNTTVYSHLDATSRAVTHGRCYEVGVAGLCLGGGIGFNMRLRGLTCDQLVETDIVLADGRTLTLNARENEDLFWACRGAGGGNFGVHTSFTFQTYPVDRVTAFNIDWDENEEEVLRALVALLPGAPREMGIKVAASVHKNDSGVNEIKVNLLGQYHGPEETLRDFLKPVYDIARPGDEVIRNLPYWAGQAVLSEDGSPLRMLERSRFVQEPMSEKALTMILQQLKKWPGIPEGRADWKFFLAGGAVADVAPDETAYVHRNAHGVSSVELEWSEPHPLELVERNLDWVDDFHEALRPYTSDRCYQNFIDERQQDYLHAYYGENLQRLVMIKQKYDPDNAFHYPQSIPTTLPQDRTSEKHQPQGREGTAFRLWRSAQ